MANDHFLPSPVIEKIRATITHPICDGDGHFVEFLPAVHELIADVSDRKVANDYFDLYMKESPVAELKRPGNRTYFGFPSDALDRATAILPGLLYHRLDEIGIDFALLYPTKGMGAISIKNADMRQAVVRAYNLYYAQTFSDLRDRLEPVAIIPMVTPQEALDELEYAVGTLGLKAVLMSGVVHREVESKNGSSVPWIDTLGHDSIYDYDPVWKRCVELKVAVGFHGVGKGWGTRTSRANYVYNHIGNFAAAQEAACRSMLIGGVFSRFPNLRCSFLEGGVSWSLQLMADLIAHYEKRNKDSIGQYDPASVDVEEFKALFREYATGPLREFRDNAEEGIFWKGSSPQEPSTVDDFDESGFSSVDDILRIFRDQLYFGCEADDPLNILSFDSRLIPKGTSINAMFASDVGHWDVPSISGILAEAYEAVDDGLLNESEFETLTFGNLTRQLTGVNPHFFDGTILEDHFRTDVPE